MHDDGNCISSVCSPPLNHTSQPPRLPPFSVTNTHLMQPTLEQITMYVCYPPSKRVGSSEGAPSMLCYYSKKSEDLFEKKKK